MTVYEGLITDIETWAVFPTLTADVWLASPYALHEGHILKFGEDPVPSNRYKVTGTVTEQSLPVVRTLRLYRTSTGELIDETTSLVNGTYELRTPYSDTHYVVCMDDDAGEDYNHLITKEAELVEL